MFKDLTPTFSAAAIALYAVGATGQTCLPQWSDEFPGSRLPIKQHAGAIFNDGAGPRLYVSGENSALRRWEMDHWVIVGVPGVTTFPKTYAMQASSVGGHALYLAGDYGWPGTPALGRSVLARWDGGSFVPVGLGSNHRARAIAVHDDGSGPAIFVGGLFESVEGIVVKRIAKWDGQTWSALGAGITSANSYVAVIAEFDDGAGTALYVGGEFGSAGGVQAKSVARWDGRKWSALAGGLELTGSTYAGARAMCTYDDGSGEVLCVGGSFDSANGQPVKNMARWNGAAWSGVGAGLTGVNGGVVTLEVLQKGATSELYAGGHFSHTPSHPTVGLAGLARWDPAAADWRIAHPGNPWPWEDPPVSDMVAGDAGEGESLYVVGGLRGALTAYSGGPPLPSWYALRYDGNEWRRMARGFDHTTMDLAVFDDATRQKLCVAGDFLMAPGEVSARDLAVWDGNAFSPFPQPLTGAGANVQYLRWLNDGRGAALYAGGYFGIDGGPIKFQVARWHGGSWTEVDPGPGTYRLRVLRAFDLGDGSHLYGMATEAPPVTRERAVRYDNGGWTTLAGPGQEFFGIYDYAAWNDGTGLALYAAMDPDPPLGPGSGSNVAKWTGTAWEFIGQPGAHIQATSLAVYPPGSGGRLYAIGGFTTAIGAVADRVASWDGSAWSDVGGGITPSCSSCATSVLTMSVADDGRGPALFVGGWFEAAGGGTVPAHGVARWDGSTWSALDQGISGLVTGLVGFNDSTGPSLFVIGDFALAGTQLVKNFAKWQGCPVCTADCNRDGLLSAADLACFQARFVAADPYADCNADGSLTVADFGCFQTKFVTGCP